MRWPSATRPEARPDIVTTPASRPPERRTVEAVDVHIHEDRWVARCRLVYAQVLAALGRDLPRARRLAQQALTTLQDAPERVGRMAGDARALLAELDAADGRRSEAESGRSDQIR